MDHVEISRTDRLAVVRLRRGKVNAINEATAGELRQRFEELEQDDTVRAVVFTGAGKFFSFGFDIPEFLSYSKDAFIRFLTTFTDLYARIFVLPKPVVAALNGHTIAGGCMLATACDRRIMASGKGRISLNEVTFGSSVFAGCVEMLEACAGHRNAETILFGGALYGPEEARGLGLVDRVVPAERLFDVAVEEAHELARGDATAFRSIKALVRGPIVERIRRREAASVREFADIWYSESTWKRLEKIEIRR